MKTRWMNSSFTQCKHCKSSSFKISINWFDCVIKKKKKGSRCSEKRKKCIFTCSKQYLSHYHGWKTPSGNTILLESKNHTNRNRKPISQSIDAQAEFQVHLVYTYKLKYNILTFKCINSNRKTLRFCCSHFQPFYFSHYII